MNLLRRIQLVVVGQFVVGEELAVFVVVIPILMKILQEPSKEPAFAFLIEELSLEL